MSIHPRTSAAANVVAGWLGVADATDSRHRSRSRADYRKTGRRRPADDGYLLGFTGFVAGLLPDTYTLVEHPQLEGCEPGRGRFAVRNPIGERFVIEIEHVQGESA